MVRKNETLIFHECLLNKLIRLSPWILHIIVNVCVSMQELPGDSFSILNVRTSMRTFFYEMPCAFLNLDILKQYDYMSSDVHEK